MAGGGPEGLDGVHAAAVAGEADHRLVGVGKLGAHRAGDAHAQRAAARQEVLACPGRLEVASDGGGRRQRLVEDNRVLGQVEHQLFHEARHLEGDGVAGGLVGAQLGGELGLLSLGQFARAAPRRVLLLGRHGCFEGVGQQGQRELRVTQHAQRDGVVLGNLVQVQVNVDRLGVAAKDVGQFGEDFGQKVGTDDEVDVALLHNRAAARPEHVARHALVVRVAVAQVDLARVGLPHLRAQQGRDAGDLFRRARVGHAVADKQHRALGLGQHDRRLADEGGVRRDAGGGDMRGVDLLGGRSIQDILGQTDVHRAHGRRGGDFDRAAQHAQDGGRVHDDGGPLGDRLGKGHQVARHLRVHVEVFDPRVAADDDQRGVPTFGLIQRTDGVAHAGRAVQLDQGRALGGAGVAVGHRHRHRFLQRQDVLQVRVVAQRVEKALLDGAGVAEHVAHPIGQELLKHHVVSVFCRHSVCFPHCVCYRPFAWMLPLNPMPTAYQP